MGYDSRLKKEIAQLQEREAALMENIGYTVPDPAGQGASNPPSVDDRILVAAKLTTGEENPLRANAATRRMANKMLRGDVDALEDARVQDLAVRDGMQLQIDANREAIALLNPEQALLASGLAEIKAIQQAEQVKLAANTLADQAQDAWLALVDAEGKETKAIAAQAKADAAANKASLLAATLKATAQQAQLDAQNLAIQATNAKAEAAQTGSADALTAANTAQSKADAADVKAQAAQTKADAAQAKADTATSKADTAKTTADAASAAAATAQTNAATAISNAAAASSQATTAQTTATNAQNNLDTFKGLFRRGVATTPAITVQLATPATVDVTFSPAFADNNYRVAISKTSAGLLPLDISAVAKTASSFTLTLRNTGLASLAVPTGTVDYIIMHS